MSVAELRALEQRYAMPTYVRAPVEFVRGEGARLWDSTGREYLDFFAGLSVHNAGHCHPRIVAAIAEQAALLAGASNLFYSEPAMRLLRAALGVQPRGRVFLCNSGAEANECAIKLVRQRAHAPRRRRARDRHPRRGLSRAHARPPSRRPASWPARTCSGRCRAAFAPSPRDDPGALRAAVGETHGRGDDRADPGRGRRLPDRRRGAGRRARGLRRGGARSSSTRSSRDGADRDPLGLRAAAGAPGRADRGEGARRRPAGGRLS